MNMIRSACGVMALVVVGFSSGCRMVIAQPLYPVGPPRTVVVVGTPRLLLIEGTGVEYCPDIEDDVFFYGGFWYYYQPTGWYYSSEYRGPWVVVETGRLPEPFIRIPPTRFKHRYAETHPAHAHHPDLDRWHGNVYQDDQGNDEGRGKGKGRGRGRGNGYGNRD